jgi:hypothetical protein
VDFWVQVSDFAASYEFSHIEETGSEISLTITLTFFNYSGAEIHNSAVVLYDSSRDLQPNRKPTNNASQRPLHSAMWTVSSLNSCPRTSCNNFTQCGEDRCFS